MKTDTAAIPATLNDRLRSAAQRLYRRGKCNGSNHAHLCPDPMVDIDGYHEAISRLLRLQQEAWDEFVAAATGTCPCGSPIEWATDEEVSDGKGVCRNCECGRRFVVGR